MSNRYVEFEERNWDWLVDGFIKKYQTEWVSFVDDAMVKQDYDPEYEPEVDK